MFLNHTFKEARLWTSEKSILFGPGNWFYCSPKVIPFPTKKRWAEKLTKLKISTRSINKLCQILQVGRHYSDKSNMSITVSGSPCSEGRSTLRWGSLGAAGWGSGCGRTMGTSRSRAALLRLYTPGRTPCGGHPPPSLQHPHCPPRLLRPPPWPPTGYPPSPGIGRVRMEKLFYSSHYYDTNFMFWEVCFLPCHYLILKKFIFKCSIPLSG